MSALHTITILADAIGPDKTKADAGVTAFFDSTLGGAVTGLSAAMGTIFALYLFWGAVKHFGAGSQSKGFKAIMSGIFVGAVGWNLGIIITAIGLMGSVITAALDALASVLGLS
jgi:hypothetical protein